MDALIRCSWGQMEERQSERYFHQNRDRPGPCLAVVQRTLKGEGFIEVEGIEYRAGVGKAMLFIHGENSSYGYPADATELYRHEFLSFEGELAVSAMQAIKERVGPVVSLARGTESDRLFKECFERMRSRKFQDVYHESSLAYGFFMALSRDALMVPLERDSIAFAEDYMQTRFRLPITVSEVASASGMSREHFTRNYRQRYGTSPGKRLQELRLEAACQLLVSTTAPVAVVASHCGYADPDSFSRAFRRNLGCNPAAWRDAAQRK